MTTKDDELQLIEKMPDEVSMEDIFAELYFKLRIGRALCEVEDRRFVSDEQARQRFASQLVPTLVR